MASDLPRAGGRSYLGRDGDLGGHHKVDFYRFVCCAVGRERPDADADTAAGRNCGWHRSIERSGFEGFFCGPANFFVYRVGWVAVLSVFGLISVLGGAGASDVSVFLALLRNVLVFFSALSVLCTALFGGVACWLGPSVFALGSIFLRRECLWKSHDLLVGIRASLRS